LTNKCPYCGREGTIVAKRSLSGNGWVVFVLLLLLCFPLCWLPFVIDNLNETYRVCSVCRGRMG